MRKILLFALAGLIVLSGCGHTLIVPTGQDSYMISKKGGYGNHDGGELKADAFMEASEYCQKMGKKIQPVSSSQNDGMPGIMASCELDFMCLNNGDPQLQRPMIQSSSQSSAPAPVVVSPVVFQQSAPTFKPIQPYQMKLPTQTHCNTTGVGNTAYTNCSSY